MSPEVSLSNSHELHASLDSPGVRSSDRLEAYSDALFSIVATVMVCLGYYGHFILRDGLVNETKLG